MAEIIARTKYTGGRGRGVIGALYDGLIRKPGGSNSESAQKTFSEKESVNKGKPYKYIL